MRVLAGAAIVLVSFVGCASEGRAAIGPLSIEVPDGWRVTRRSPDSIQIADGTAGAGTEQRAGTATVVFDVFVKAPITSEEFGAQLLEDNVGAKRDTLTIDGHEAVVLSYTGPAVAGRQEAVFIDALSVQIVYRAAFPNDEAAFSNGLDEFRQAIRSIAVRAEPAA